MAKLTLDPAPTFGAEVPIPVAGGDPVPVRIIFKHRTKDELTKFVESRKNKSDEASFLDMVSGWDLDDEFNPANVKKLLQNYIGTALVTYVTYIDELTKAKRGN